LIPKKIHYIWFGGNPLTPLANKCVASWKKYCPDYEIIRWDESNFDIEQNLYCKEAYDAKKWAFASDYARLWVLVNEGGIYMDTDVEVLKPLDEFLCLQSFSGFEAEDRLPTGIMASRRQEPFFMKLLHDYDNRPFVLEDGSYDLTTNVTAITNACIDAGIVLNNTKQTVEGFTLYPSDFFCPKSPSDLRLHLTENSHTIHHFDGSWTTPEQRFHRNVARIIGPKATKVLKKLMGRG
jgi:mannosyltransferase OCH1-like enzyme